MVIYYKINIYDASKYCFKAKRIVDDNPDNLITPDVYTMVYNNNSNSITLYATYPVAWGNIQFRITSSNSLAVRSKYGNNSWNSWKTLV